MLKVADECWVALANLHRSNPLRESFRPTEILGRVKADSQTPVRPGVQPHIAVHNVANAAPNPAQYRMFYKLASGELRLFRAGDIAHPQRKGKIRPVIEDLPPDMHNLIDWYDTVYSRQVPVKPEEDPVLAMIGVGEELWKKEDGDTFIRRLRDERNWQAAELSNTADELWSRLVKHQGEYFVTITGKKFRYEVDGNGVWFERDGRRINRRLGRKDFDKAASRLPLRTTTDIKDCSAPAFLYGVLTDSRIVLQSDIAA